MDAEARGDPHPVALLQVGVQGLHGPDNPEPGAHGALGVVFMGLGIAKVDEQAIAEILGNVPVHAFDHLSTGVLVTNGVSLLQTNKHNSTCWSYYHGHTLPPSGAKACNPARNGGRYGHPRFYHGLILPGR